MTIDNKAVEKTTLFRGLRTWREKSELDYTHHRQVKGLGHIGDGKGRGMMLHTCLAVVPIPLNPQILGLAGQIPWLRSQNKDNHNTLVEALPELLRTDGEGEIWAEMVESIGTAPAPQTGSIWVSVGDRGSDIFSYLRRAKALYRLFCYSLSEIITVTHPKSQQSSTEGTRIRTFNDLKSRSRSSWVDKLPVDSG